MKDKNIFLETRNIILDFIPREYPDITLYEGDFLILQGKNGIGKTSLLETLCQLHNNFQGNIDIKQELSINYMFDNYPLVGDFTVHTNLGLENSFKKKYSSKENDAMIVAELTKFGLEKLQYNKVKTLSSGEKQKVSFIRSILNNPDILVLDEPTSHLDIKSSYFLLDEILEKSKGMTIILVNHNSFEIEYLKKRRNNIIELIL